MNWKQALAESELPEGQRKVVTVAESKILLIRHQQNIYAMEHACPHMKLPLQKGEITEDCAIICPWHKSAFDLKTGDAKAWSPWPPLVGKLLGKISRQRALKVYDTKIESGMIWVKVS